MGTATADLIATTREKANVSRSNFVTDAEIVKLLNEARSEFRELLISADDSYYRGVLDFNVSADPDNYVTLPADFWRMRGLDMRFGTTAVDEVYAREFRNRHDGDGPGYYLDGADRLVLVPGRAATMGNPYRLYYTPTLTPLGLPATPRSRAVVIAAGDVSLSGTLTFPNPGTVLPSDLGGTLTIAGASNAGNNGAKTILAVPDDATVIVDANGMTAETFGIGVTATIQPAATGTRTFAINSGSDINGPNSWSFANGGFTASDYGARLTVDLTGANEGDSGEFQIVSPASATSVYVIPSPTLTAPPPAGTVTLDWLPLGTVGELDANEELFKEYFPVRAAMAIARKKRQDTLVAQLGSERVDIEGRISQMGKGRQSEPQQAPVLWRPNPRRYDLDDWEL